MKPATKAVRGEAHLKSKRSGVCEEVASIDTYLIHLGIQSIRRGLPAELAPGLAWPAL